MEDADALFVRILEQDVRQADALIGRARVALNSGASADPTNFFRSVLADQPGHAEAWLGPAVVTYKQRPAADEENWYQRMTQLRLG